MRFKTQLVFIVVVAFLSSLSLRAQDCDATVLLESQTIKSGSSVTFVAGTIINQPGKQFVVDNGGSAALQASKRIEIYYGFKAMPGSVVRAVAAPCDPDQPIDPVVVYPNPTDGMFTVKASYKIDAVRLTDMDGMVQLVKTDVGSTSVDLDITKLKQGYYILEVIAGKDVVEAIRIEKK